jgi:precorrin-6B methylase 1
VSKRPGSLTIVGTGIKFGLQTTPEARSCIERADKVLYVFADPLPVAWVKGLNPSAESLEGFYSTRQDRQKTYDRMVEEILEWLRKGIDVCVVLYGHPGVFVNPSHEAIRRARAEGFTAQMLPAVSAEDCLVADLGFDPGAWGCQSYEATSFLLYRRRFDTSTPLILWQVAGAGVRRAAVKPSRSGFRILADHLEQHYGPNHEVVLYEASPYPVFGPIIERVRIRDLPRANLTPMSTMLVPPKRPPRPDPEMVARLGLQADDQPRARTRQPPKRKATAGRSSRRA